MPNYFTVPALAEHLGVHVRKLRKWIVRGKVRAPELLNPPHYYGYDGNRAREIEEWYMEQLRERLPSSDIGREDEGNPIYRSTTQ